MGSRILLALVAALLVGAGIVTWVFMGEEGDADPAAGPVAAERANATAETDPVTVATPEPASDAGGSRARQEAAPRPGTEPVATTVDEADDGAAVTGRVVDKLGNAIGGAEVRLTSALGTFGLLGGDDEPRAESVTTEDDGTFRLEGAPGRRMHLTALAPGFAPLEPKEVAIPESGANDVGVLTLSHGAILSGHVFDATGRPVEGARLFDASMREGMLSSASMIVRTREPLAVTEADGSFRIESLACGTWKLLVHHEDHPSFDASGVADVPGAEVSGLRLQFAPTGSISGRVVGIPEEGSGRLAVRARLYEPGGSDFLDFSVSGPRQVDCAADGSFVLKGLEAGQVYELHARERAGGGVHGLLIGGSTRSDRVVARAGDSGVELVYNLGATLTFRVVDAESGEPVTAMTVSAGVEWPMALRGEDGRVLREFEDGQVEVAGLYPRESHETARIEIDAVGYYGFEVEGVELVLGESVDLGVVRLEPAPVVVVNVTDRKSGAPVTGATVRLTPAPEEQPDGVMSFDMDVTIGDHDAADHAPLMRGGEFARTDEHGVAVLNSLEGQDCVLRVESDGHAPFEVPRLYLPPGERVERDVELRQGGSVLVTVYDPEGRPLPGVEVAHREPSAGPRVMRLGSRAPEYRTDSSGQVRFANLEAGTHAFRIEDSAGSGGFISDGDAMVMIAGAPAGGGDEEWSEVQVAEGAESEVVLEASPRGLVEGTVREAGVPLAGATLALKKKSRERGPGGMDLSAMFGGGGPTARTDGDGYYSFDGVKPGEYELEVTHPGRALPSMHDLIVNERGGEVYEQFDLDLPVSVIEGRVTDREGNPLSNVEVWAEKSSPGGQFVAMRMVVFEESDGGGAVSFGNDLGDGSVRTDAEGFYRLRGVPAGTELEVYADAEDFQKARSELVSVEEDSVRAGVDLVLEPAGSMEISVFDAEGNPPSMTMVFARFLGEGEVDPEQVMVGSDGVARLRGLRPGPWSVSAQRLGRGMGGLGGDEGSRTVNVAAGETATTSLDAP